MSVSVVIPTLGARAEFFDTINSVLRAEKVGGIEECIVCVNAGVDSDSLVSRLRPQLPAWIRVEIADDLEVLPLVDNWNRCVELTSGTHVHILHDDDLVSPFFYKEIESLIVEFPGASIYTTGFGFFGINKIYDVPYCGRGVWNEALCEIRKRNRFQCVAVVFDKTRFDGFDSKYKYLPDWKAWCDLAAKGEVVCSDQILGFYRQHAGAVTNRIFKSGLNLKETEMLLLEVGAFVHVDEVRDNVAEVGYGLASRAARNGDFKIMWAQLAGALSRRVWLFRILQVMVFVGVYWGRCLTQRKSRS